MRIDDYSLLEELIRQLLDDLRNAHFMLARNAAQDAIDPLLAEARATHARLAAALPLDPDRARALGYLLTDLLGERIGSLQSMAGDPSRRDEAVATRRTPTSIEAEKLAASSREDGACRRGTSAPKGYQLDD